MDRDDVLTTAELAEVLACKPSGTVIIVWTGEWRSEGPDTWRWYGDPELEDVE